MAYADRDVAGSRVVATVVVSILVFLLTWAFVTGLTSKFTKAVQEKLNTFDVAPPPPPPPPDKPPPPPPDQPMKAPPVVSPPVNVPVQSPMPPIVSVPVAPPVQVVVPPAPPAPPPKPVVSQRAGLKGDVSRFFGPDAYPPSAIRAEAQGRVVASLSVGPDGRVSSCTVTSSSGNSDLDDATCRIARSKVRFTPAKDDAGNPTASTFTLPVRWVLPSD
ncbi:MAG: energy transducer TonB [Sphingomonas sp.]|jgi:protein TonB|uniref:energy transducer TonB n=1 Tax=Sphingomonas sp. TaxID=28214 RepID=UPI003561387E